MEKQPSFDNIVGGTEEQKEGLKQDAEIKSQQTGEEIFGEYLVTPEENEKKAIKDAVDYANATASRYGANRTTDIERVFLLQPDGIESFTDGDLRDGLCNSLQQAIAIDRVASNALLATRVVHECFHMSSYQAAQIFKDGTHYPYRNGIEMEGRDKEGGYFSAAQEAIIAILSRRFFNEVVLKDPLFHEEMEYTASIKKWLTTFAENNIADEEKKEKILAFIEDILILPDGKKVATFLEESTEGDSFKFGYFGGYFEDELESGNVMQERSEERDVFNKVLDRIISDSDGKINDREELFDDFARAHFSGNYLPLARKIDSVFGVGAFRKLATELGEIKE